MFKPNNEHHMLDFYHLDFLLMIYQLENCVLKHYQTITSYITPVTNLSAITIIGDSADYCETHIALIIMYLTLHPQGAHKVVIGNCFYFWVSFCRHPLHGGMQQSTFFLKATLSIAAFSNFENMDFALADFLVSMSFMSLPLFIIICCIQFSDGLPGLRLAGINASARDLFEMVLGHVLFSMILSCLWNALIFSSIYLVTVHSSHLLYSMTEFMKSVNVVIFSLSDVCFDLKISLRVFILSVTSIFLLSMSCFVPSNLPSSLHFFQSELLLLMMGW